MIIKFKAVYFFFLQKIWGYSSMNVIIMSLKNVAENQNLSVIIDDNVS